MSDSAVPAEPAAPPAAATASAPVASEDNTALGAPAALPDDEPAGASPEPPFPLVGGELDVTAAMLRHHIERSMLAPADPTEPHSACVMRAMLSPMGTTGPRIAIDVPEGTVREVLGEAGVPSASGAAASAASTPRREAPSRETATPQSARVCFGRPGVRHCVRG
jgi:hypothetical protein